MNNNLQRLGDTLATRMKKTAGAAVPTTLELGTITGNLSLTTDSLRSAIPKGEYMVNLMLTGSGPRRTENADDGHNHMLPDMFRSLQAGDRVLVAWCGNEPVVLAIVAGS